MKQFDIELAKAGYSVGTIGGFPVRILTFNNNDFYPILAVVDYGKYEEAIPYHANGRRYFIESSDVDLVIID